ncbi:hypothetical protein HA402_005233, partial [Bradysia odoriphaga]
STSRYADLEKPKKKKTLSATSSLVSIPNTIKLSMLNSGLLSFGYKFTNLKILIRIASRIAGSTKFRAIVNLDFD